VQRAEDLGGRIGRHGLRQEHVLELPVQMRLDLLDGVGAHGQRRVHHQARVAQHLFARVVLQQLARDQAGCRKAGQEHDHQHQIELEA
jgi:hypothetical protein